MADVALTAYAGIHDIDESEHPLLDAEALRPCLEHRERKLLSEVREAEPWPNGGPANDPRSPRS